MNQKKWMMLVGAVVGISLSIVLYLRSNEEEPPDPAVQAVKETFTCNKCNAQMELTIAQQAEMLSSKGGKIICASCGKEGPQKPVMVRVSGDNALQPPAPAVGAAGTGSTREPPQTSGGKARKRP